MTHDAAAAAEALRARVLAFWFGAPSDAESRDGWRAEWFRVEAAFDAACIAQFADACRRAAAGELDALSGTPEGALALVLLLDQLPRNIHRGRPEAFAADAGARAVAEQAIARGFDASLSKLQRLFLYLPFEHSENLADQQRAVTLIGALGDATLLDYARRHRDVIARFGRFPHRNAILGRNSTAEEAIFLQQPGASF